MVKNDVNKQFKHNSVLMWLLFLLISEIFFKHFCFSFMSYYPSVAEQCSRTVHVLLIDQNYYEGK